MNHFPPSSPPPPDFQALFEGAPGLYLVLTPDLLIVGASNAYLHATMTIREKIQGRPLFDVFPDNPDDPAATGTVNLRASLQRVLKNRAPDTMAIQKYDIRRPDSEGGGFEVRYWSPVNTPVLGADGGVRYILHRVEDVTAMVLLKEEQTEGHRLSEQRFKNLMEAAPDAMIIVDREGRIVLLNKQAEVIFGHKREGLLGKPMEQLMPDRYRGRHVGHRTGFLANAKARPMGGAGYDLWGLRSDGTEFPVEISLSPMESPEGSVVIAAIRDITERRKVEQEILGLNQALGRHAQDLEAANKELEAFSYSVSHDLRAPLRAIAGFSQVLMEEYADKLDAEGRRLLGIVTANTKTMGQLIDDLLSLSRLTRQGMAASDVDMEALVKSVWQDLQSAVSGPMPLLCLGEMPRAYGDRSLLRQVLINLVSNAVKYSSKTAGARVEIGGNLEGDEFVYYVRDNGVGFDMTYVDKVFDVFQRLHSAEEFEGTGVGLAIVHRLVRRHGGRVWAKGKVGAGAAFFFTLPVIKERCDGGDKGSGDSLAN